MIEHLTQRNSHGKLISPAPSSEQLQEILQASFRAPDHAWLRPTRLISVQGDERDLLNEAFVEHAKQSGASQMKIDKASGMAHRAPLLIIVVCQVTDNAKVPEWEQIASSSVALAYSQLAAESMGFGTMWRTGDMAGSDVVKAKLKLAKSDQIVGYLYIGTKEGKEKSLPECAQSLPVHSLSEWLND